MLEKYFGLLKIHDEYSVMEAFIDYSRLGSEQITLINRMSSALIEQHFDTVEELYIAIRKITNASIQMFEHVPELIISAAFDHQKQYDLLRVYQRMNHLASQIIATAKRILIVTRLGSPFPEELVPDLNEMSHLVDRIYSHLLKTLNMYLTQKTAVIDEIGIINEMEGQIDHHRALFLQVLYRLANDNRIPVGTCRAIETMIDHLESLADAVQETASSLEWLLLH